MLSKISLTICIPTFNRPHKVIKLLNFLYYENKKIDSSKLHIEIILGDNSSDDLTFKACNDSNLYREHSIIYIKNEVNLGLIGNVLNLAGLAKGDYVWFMGDDDDYHENIFLLVQDAILEDNYAYIFLNHCGYYEGKKQTTGFQSAVDVDNGVVFDDGKIMALSIWNFSRTSMMFISAGIFRRKELEKCIDTTKKKDLAYPLYMSFFCAAQGKTKIIVQVCIDNVWGHLSWSKYSDNVFLLYVPRILYCLPKIGYNYFKVRKLFFKYQSFNIRGYVNYFCKTILKIERK